MAEAAQRRLIRVLVDDPDPLAGAALRAIFSSDTDFDVHAGRPLDEPGRSQTPMRARVAVLTVADGSRASMASIEQLSAVGVAVLTLTLHEDDDLLVATLRAGASGNRVKSTHPDELVHAVRRLAEGHPALSERQSRLVLDDWARRRRTPEEIDAQRATRSLTAREREVVAGVTRGMTNNEIARALHCSPTTVKAHLAAVFTRLGVTNRVRVAVIGMRAGLLGDD